MKLEGKKAIVTGAAKGMGAAITTTLVVLCVVLGVCWRYAVVTGRPRVP